MTADPLRRPITVAICTLDGRARIGEALDALAGQHDPGVPWRVLVIDNGSSDGTAGFAVERWEQRAPGVPLTVVVEHRRGLLHGRVRAFTEAGEGLVVFVDDDNVLDPDYLRTVAGIFAERPTLGAVGGVSRLPPGVVGPPSMQRLLEAFAIGRSTSIRLGSPMPWGAGLAVRVEAFLPLVEAGYVPVHASRGDDTEVGLLLRGMGWELAVDDRLTMVHAIDLSRLTPSAYRSMSRENGRTSLALRLYEDAVGTGSCGSWPGALLRSLGKAAASLVPRRAQDGAIDNRRVHAVGRLGATIDPVRFRRLRRTILGNVALARACPGPDAAPVTSSAAAAAVTAGGAADR